MATFTATRAAASFPVFQAQGTGKLQVAYAELAITANPVAADLYKLCVLPAGAKVLGGMLYASDIDTNATETLDMDIGWAANGGSGTYDALDADGLGNLGVWVGDAFAGGNVLGVAGNAFVLAGILATGIHPYFTKKTTIQLTCVATAATFAAGSVAIAVHYAVDESLVA